MTEPIHPVIRRYANGAISANKAADLLGGDTNVGDVIFMLKQAGLQPPQQAPEQARAELARAMAILGMTPKSP